MPDLSVTVESVAPVEHALTPELAFRLRVREATGGDVESVLLAAQVRLEAARRPYTPDEQDGLLELFGPPQRWGRTLRSMLWTTVSAVVPRFSGEGTVDLVVPCTFDLEVASAKYLVALTAGEVPLTFLFSGTVFFRDAEGALQVSPIPWSAEAGFGLPVETWRRLIDEHHPEGAWLRLRRDTYARLSRYRARRGLPTWERVVDDLLARAEEPAST